MKILIFCQHFVPYIGGLEFVIEEFAQYLVEKDAIVTIFTSHLPEDTPASDILFGGKVKVIRFPAFHIIPNYPLPKFWNFYFWKEIAKIFREKKYDIVFSFMRFSFISLIALLYSKIKGIRWIHVEHGSSHVQLSSKFKTFLAKIYDYSFGWLIFKSSDVNVSVSHDVRNFIARFDSRKSPIIFNCINEKKIEAIAKDEKIREDFKNKIILVFAGRLYKWKGVENSIKAVRKLPQNIKDRIVFLIIGNGEDFEKLKKMSQNEQYIKMLGALPREKVVGIFKNADIYLHSAMPGGGLSGSLLEAMYCGCAAIAMPNEGALDVVNNGINGIIVRNEEELREAIITMVNNKQKRISYSTRAKNTILGNFTWESVIKEYWKLIRI